MDIDELHQKGWEKPGMMVQLWVLSQPGSLSSRIPQQAVALGSLFKDLENLF